MNKLNFPEDDRTLDLIGIGRLCVDLNANEIHRPMEETVTFTKYVGGSPANITIAAARLGLRTGFIGKVSNDQHGRFITGYLERDGIDTSNVAVDQTGAVTGLAFTEIKSPTDCSILMYRDNVADLKLEPSEVSEEYIRSARALLISGTALAKSPSREAVLVALEYARRWGTRVIFDIDYRPYTWTSREETGIYCRLVAEKSDCIIGGRDEFNLMELFDGPLRGDDAWTANHWLDRGASIVVVKKGGDGSTVFTKDGDVYPGSTFPAKVVKTFGAGDSFAGAFIYGLMNGWEIARCQRFGAASASLVVSSHSCSDAMPTVQQIRERIERYDAFGV